MKKLALTAVVTVETTAGAPAFAKSKIGGCTEAGMSKADGMVMKMPDGESKTMAMQEMIAAKSSRSQQDMAGCSMHMGKAMKMTS